jgi:hypothetical protein
MAGRRPSGTRRPWLSVLVTRGVMVAGGVHHGIRNV